MNGYVSERMTPARLESRNSEAKDNFLSSLELFIRNTENSAPFKGKTAALRSLKRISTLSALR